MQYKQVRWQVPILNNQHVAVVKCGALQLVDFLVLILTHAGEVLDVISSASWVCTKAQYERMNVRLARCHILMRL